MNKINNSDYGLAYSANYNRLSLVKFGNSGDFATTTILFLDSFSYSSSFGDIELSGTIENAKFTSNSALPYTSYDGPSDTETAMAEFTRVDLCDAIDWLKMYIIYHNLGITLSDLGLTSY